MRDPSAFVCECGAAGIILFSLSLSSFCRIILSASVSSSDDCDSLMFVVWIIWLFLIVFSLGVQECLLKLMYSATCLCSGIWMGFRCQHLGIRCQSVFMAHLLGNSHFLCGVSDLREKYRCLLALRTHSVLNGISDSTHTHLPRFN